MDGGETPPPVLQRDKKKPSAYRVKPNYQFLMTLVLLLVGLSNKYQNLERNFGM